MISYNIISYHTLIISYYTISYHIPGNTLSYLDHIISYHTLIISYYTISYHIISYHTLIISYHTISYIIIPWSYHITLVYHIIPDHILSYLDHIILYHIISYHTLIISYYTISYHMIPLWKYLIEVLPTPPLLWLFVPPLLWRNLAEKSVPGSLLSYVYYYNTIVIVHGGPFRDACAVIICTHVKKKKQKQYIESVVTLNRKYNPGKQ